MFGLAQVRNFCRMSFNRHKMLGYNCTIKNEFQGQCNLLIALLFDRYLSASFEFVGIVLPSLPISR